jgi:ornithine cyclodeaminase
VDLLYLQAEDIRRLLPMEDCIQVMEHAFAALGRGDVVQPLRTVIHRPDGAGSLYVMPAFTARPAALAVKLISLFHGNLARGLPSHQGIVVVFDADTGAPAAILDAASLTATRTAAVSALATRLLARPDASDLAILGAGVQAWSHLEAMRIVRPIRRVRVWSPHAARRQAFAAGAATLHGLPVEAVANARDAVKGADIICTVTSASAPVLRADWVARGAHINAVGASTPTAREVDTELVVRARVIVDSLLAALSEAGDLIIPMSEGAIDEGGIAAELADLVLGSAPGRRGPDQITLFKSLGLAVEDAAAAARVLERATAS